MIKKSSLALVYKALGYKAGRCDSALARLSTGYQNYAPCMHSQWCSISPREIRKKSLRAMLSLDGPNNRVKIQSNITALIPTPWIGSRQYANKAIESYTRTPRNVYEARPIRGRHMPEYM